MWGDTMDVTFYSFTKKPNSTAIPSGSGLTTAGTVVEPFSVTEPVLDFFIDFYGVTLKNANYAYIPTFDRYYFIDRQIFSDGKWRIYMSVDVLASWKQSILNTSAYVLRNEFSCDPYIVDTTYPIKAGPSVRSTTLPELFSPDGNNNVYVLGILSAKTNAGTGGVTYYLCNESLLTTIFNTIFNAGNFYSTITDVSESLFKALFNPTQYIVSCMRFPFSDIPAGAQSASAINIGYWSFPVTPSIQVLGTTTTTRFSLNATLANSPFANPSRMFLNARPYTNFNLTFPPFGTITLDNPILDTNKDIQIQIDVDMITGDGILRVMSVQDNNYTQITPNYTAKVGVTNPVTSITTKNGAAGAYLNTAATTINTASELLNLPSASIAGYATSALKSSSCDITLIGGPESMGQYYGFAYIQAVFYDVTNVSPHEYGYPLYKEVLLSTLYGYTRCAHGLYQNALALQSEINKINSLLEEGIYIE